MDGRRLLGGKGKRAGKVAGKVAGTSGKEVAAVNSNKQEGTQAPLRQATYYLPRQVPT